MFYYAGIGSRKTPEVILKRFENIASLLAQKGGILRSGAADGADNAFEKGCDKEPNSKKEIYLPWKGFNGSESKLYTITPEAMLIAQKFHPYWDNLSNGAKKLHARNSYQVLGYDLKTLSNFVVCWTEGGKITGGTGQALRIAKAYSIPVFNYGEDGAEEKLLEFIESI